MQAFLEYVVKGLVQNPDAVTLTPVEREGTTVYELRLHPQDVGKIIGRQGMTINAIRALLLAGSAKKGLRCTLEIVEDKPAPLAAGVRAAAGFPGRAGGDASLHREDENRRAHVVSCDVRRAAGRKHHQAGAGSGAAGSGDP